MRVTEDKGMCVTKNKEMYVTLDEGMCVTVQTTDGN